MLMETFTCSMCNNTFPVQKSGGTGYAVTSNDKKICYNCCAEIDKREMDELVKKVNNKEKVTSFFLYLTNNNSQISNWSGILKYNILRTRTGKHNIARIRIDAWFKDHSGHLWHGVQYGKNTDIIRCKPLKGNNK